MSTGTFNEADTVQIWWAANKRERHTSAGKYSLLTTINYLKQAKPYLMLMSLPMWSNCCLSGMCRRLTLGSLEMIIADIYWAASSFNSGGDTKSSNLLAIFKCHLCIQPISDPLSCLSSSCLPHTIFFKCVCPVTLNQISLNRLSLESMLYWACP